MTDPFDFNQAPDTPSLPAQAAVPVVRAESHLLAILDALPDLMFEVDPQGRYLDYHSPRTDLLAAPAADFLGRTMREVLPAATAEACMACFAGGQ